MAPNAGRLVSCALPVRGHLAVLYRAVVPSLGRFSKWQSGKVWRAPKSSSVLDGGGKYGWASPLFSTFRLTTDAGSVRLAAGLDDPGPSTFASSLRDRLSITTIHLPMVPSALNDEAAWGKVAPLPEHQAALESFELREWLHYLAHTSIKDGLVEMPLELRASPIFRTSAWLAEELVRTSAPSFSEKDMADFALQLKRESKAAVKNAVEKERAAQLAAHQLERAAAAGALEKERAAAAEREAALQADLERLKGSGSDGIP